MKRLIARYLSDQRGVTAIEYAMIAGLLSIAIVTAVDQLGVDVNQLFILVANAFK